MFDTIVSQMQQVGASESASKIKLKDYLAWQKNFTFEALKDPHYGRNFCKRFDISDYRICFERNWERCDNLIRGEWIANHASSST